MSSKYTTTNLPINGQKNWVITLVKVLRALDSLKGITNHSNNLFLVLNAVFHSYPDQILIWWYPLLKFILEKIVAPEIKSSISSRPEMGNNTCEWSYWFRSYPQTCTMCHSSLAQKVRELHTCSNFLWWTPCQVTLLSAVVTPHTRQCSFYSGAGWQSYSWD